MIERLACMMGRNDETPNIELAEYLCRNGEENGIKEIVAGFNGKDKAIANDCIKVLYEIGDRAPELIGGYADDFIRGLKSSNNRLVWGSMTALAKIAAIAPRPIYERLGEVISAYENGSTITVDNSVSVFAGLCKADAGYAKTVTPILLRHLAACRPKEVPQHAERASVCFNGDNAGAFIKVLEERRPELTASQQARVDRLLKLLAVRNT